MKETNFPWSMPVAVAGIPDTGQHFDLAADEDTRAKLAKLAGLRALRKLEASFNVEPHGANGLHVSGHVAAAIGQTCVVTLEPLDNEVEENVALIFAPAREPVAGTADDGTTTGSVAPGAPEPLVGGSIDRGALATEFLLLGIDPYPRKPGVEFKPASVGDAGTHPFAALAALKKDRDIEND